uniref:Putative secreted protein n=1 Tax=Anopheles darlingi TaxID=43151 RepID=A0A2M4D506_ANODA
MISRRIFFPLTNICPSASSCSFSLIFFGFRVASAETISNPPSAPATFSTVLWCGFPLAKASSAPASSPVSSSDELSSLETCPLETSCRARRLAFLPSGSFSPSVSLSSPSTFTPDFLYAAIS